MAGRDLVVEADGGSRGNPGVAGYGALVRDPANGKVLVELAEPIGLASNNVAEYSGLIAGLEAARDLAEGPVVEARLDSKLVVEQMSGRWKIKHEDMRRLALEARDVVREIEAAGGSVRYTWVPRAENAAADALSNLGMDGESIHRVPVESESMDALEAQESASTVEVTSGEERPARVVLVRHGVTRHTEAGVLDGRGGSDPELSHAGREQAAAAAASVVHLLGGTRARVLTSSLTRAVQTGGTIAGRLGVRAEVDEDWDEQCFGDWDGRSVRDLVEEDQSGLHLFRNDTAYRRPGGESHEQLRERVLAALERVVDAGGTTVVVCHRMPILVVLSHVLGSTPEMAWRLAISPGSLTALEFWPDGGVVVSFTNRT